jgi:hypothetical protein
MAAIAAVRPFFVSGENTGWYGRGLILLALVGCGSTILHPDAPAALPLVTVLAGAAFLIWFLSADYPPASYLPAVAILSAVLAEAWYIGTDEFVVYTMNQYTALAFYWVNSSVLPTGASSTNPVSSHRTDEPISERRRRPIH